MNRHRTLAAGSVACGAAVILLGVVILAHQRQGRAAKDESPRGASSTTRPTTEPSEPHIADIAANYKKLQPITKAPVDVNMELAMLCRGATQDDVDRAREKSGPHTYTQISIYMNEVAADAFAHASKKYPSGAIIVKEKLGNVYSKMVGDERRDLKTASGVGGMVKRAPGFDPDHGDWEYFYFENVSKIESGKIASCVKCHAGAADKDYVFGSWKRGD